MSNMLTEWTVTKALLKTQLLTAYSAAVDAFNVIKTTCGQEPLQIQLNDILTINFYAAFLKDGPKAEIYLKGHHSWIFTQNIDPLEMNITEEYYTVKSWTEALDEINVERIIKAWCIAQKTEPDTDQDSDTDQDN